MIRTLQKRFILAALEALLAVLAVTLLAVNLGYRASVRRTLDQKLEYLAENDVGPSLNMLERQPASGGGDTEDMTEFFMAMRYFILAGSEPSDIPPIGLLQLAYVTDENGPAFLTELLAEGVSFGYRGDFRYYVAANAPNAYKVVFLACADELAAMRSLLVTSLTVGVLCFLLAMTLVILLSRKAIRPFAENIERQKRFITDASHEIKTPLGIITSDVDMLAMEYGENEWTRSAQGQTDRLAGLVDDLILLSRLDEEARPPEPAPFCLTDAAAEELETIRPRAEEKTVGLTAALEPGLTTTGDESAFRQILSILLDNAVRYVPAGGQIRLALSGTGKKQLLEVTNTCEDLASLDLTRLFDRFYRGDGARARPGGYGLGLSIARSVAEKTGWSLRVRKENGNNIVFSLET